MSRDIWAHSTVIAEWIVSYPRRRWGTVLAGLLLCGVLLLGPMSTTRELTASGSPGYILDIVEQARGDHRLILDPEMRRSVRWSSVDRDVNSFPADEKAVLRMWIPFHESSRWNGPWRTDRSSLDVASTFLFRRTPGGPWDGINQSLFDYSEDQLGVTQDELVAALVPVALAHRLGDPDTGGGLWEVGWFRERLALVPTGMHFSGHLIIAFGIVIALRECIVAMASSWRGPRLDECRCGYDLAGLPRGSRCPECGV